MTIDLVTPPQNIEAEQSVIGGLMLECGSERTESVLATLKPEAFYSRQHQVIYEEIISLHRQQIPIDLLTLVDALDSKGITETIGGFAYLAELSKNTPSAANIQHYAAQVRDKAMMRFGINKAAWITELFYANNGMTATEKFEAVQTVLTEITDHAKTGRRRGALPFRDLMLGWLDRVNERLEDPDKARGISTGIGSLDDLLSPKGLVRGSLFVIGARPKMGKAMAMDSKILLQDGSWTTHGDIKVGQLIASVNGKHSEVTGVFPQGMRRMYQVTFEDGRTLKAADSHLWEISSSKFVGSRIVDTDDLQRMLEKTRFQGRLCVPSVSGDFGKSQSEIDGWVLGALLGDGSLTEAVKFTNSEDYVLTRMAGSVSPHRFVKVGENDYLISNKKGCKNPLLEKIREFGLFGKTACQKEIPEFVFSSDKETRVGVLTGLLETDGWVEKFGCIRFSSSSKKLTQGLIRLVHSLGGTAKETLRTDISYSYKGENLAGMDAHMASLKLPDAIINSIESPRIRKNLGINRLGNRGVGIKSVVEIAQEECLCIMVSHPRHLYVTDDYIVTHNTTLYGQMAINCALNEKLPAVLFSLEMPNDQIIERMVGQTSGVNTDIFYGAGYDDSKFALAGAKALELAECDRIFIDDTPGVKLSHIQAECRRIKRQEGQLGLVLVDYLTLMAAEKAERANLGYGMITMGLKNLAKELDCVVILLTQLNRGLEGRASKRPRASDSRETGSIEQDCDYWLGIHCEEDESGVPDLSFTEYLLPLNRHGKTGVCYVEQRNGAVYDLNQQDAARRASEGRNKNGDKPKRYSKKGGF